MKLSLDSIARQSIKPNKIYVNIPWVFKRDNSIKYVIPNWLKEYPNVVINRTQDYGPATKLIGVIEAEKSDPNTIIITIDDDTIYPKHIVRDLAKQYLPGIYKNNFNQNSVITGIGVNYLFDSNFDIYGVPVTIGDRPSLIVHGFGGVAYRRDFFKEDIFLLTKNMPASCFFADDLMISAYLLGNNIDIVKISGISYNPIIVEMFLKQLPVGFKSDALHKGADGAINNSGMDNNLNYTNCLSALSKNNKKYVQVLLAKSRIIYVLSREEELHSYIIQLSYDYLRKLINFLPFMDKFIAMGF